MADLTRHEHDVLIIGSGGAGLRAAIAASAAGASVGLVCKSLLGKAHTVMAEIHAQESPARVRELEAWGALFDRTKEGKILQHTEHVRRQSLPLWGMTCIIGSPMPTTTTRFRSIRHEFHKVRS